MKFMVNTPEAFIFLVRRCAVKLKMDEKLIFQANLVVQENLVGVHVGLNHETFEITAGQFVS